jgi:hypothetical protein
MSSRRYKVQQDLQDVVEKASEKEVSFRDMQILHLSGALDITDLKATELEITG